MKLSLFAWILLAAAGLAAAWEEGADENLRGSRSLTSPNATVAELPGFGGRKLGTWTSNPVPSKVPKWYFNYDPNDKKYGPKAWEDFDKDKIEELPDYEYFKKYEKQLKTQLKKGLRYNYCGWKKYDDDQAPIDLNNKDVNSECYEYHQLREKRGNYQLTDSEIEVQILANKLRIEYPGKLNDENPTADIPYKWGKQFPVVHADLIIPSAHTIDGKRYAAEYQVWVMSQKKKGGGRGAAVISAVVDIGAHNEHLQVAIDAWQKKYDEDKKPGNRRKLKLGDGSSDVAEGRDLRKGKGKGNEKGRGKGRSGWNPFHHSLLPSYYWWGYEGTTMEPPCYPITEYRVTDTPMKISQAQLDKLEELLFTHCEYDDKKAQCVPTSNHHNGSVARPVQPTKGRDLHRCTCIDFYPDKKRNECDPDSRVRNKKICPRDCSADKNHLWYKLDCPPWYGDNCPKWYKGR